MARPKKRAKPESGTPEPESERLTFKQRQFVSHFLGEANGNATEAARMAGYSSPKQQGTENLAKPSIAAAIAAKLEGPAMHADEVLARLSDMASVDMADFVTVTESSHKIDIPKAVKSGKSHLIKKLTPTKFGLSIELHDSQAALEKLGRYHGLFKDKVIVAVEDEHSKTEAVLERKRAEFAERRRGGGTS